MSYCRRRFLMSTCSRKAALWMMLAALSIPETALAQFKMPDQKSLPRHVSMPQTSGSAILKGNGTGGFSNAISGVDYAPASSGNSILKGNGAGGFSSAVSGMDYVPPVDINNHVTLQASDAEHDGNVINEIGTDSSDNVVIGGGATKAITFNNSTAVNQGQFSSGAYLDAPANNPSFTGGTEKCAQKIHNYTLAANATITLSCSGTQNQTLEYFLVQPNTGPTFTYSFVAVNGAQLFGDSPTACRVNGCIDQVEVTWAPALNDYIINLVKANITGIATCPAGQTCYYVAASGSDSNSGTDPAHPWQSINKVESILSTLNPGDEVLFHGGDTWAAGVNNPSLMIGDTSAHAVAGSATKSILFTTYGPGRAIIDGNNVNGYCFAALNPGFSAQYFTINNFECMHAFAQGIYFKTYSTSTPDLPGITISNNYVHNTGPGCATSNGACLGSPPAWTAGNSYGIGSIVHPNASNSNNSSFQNQSSCTSGSSQPNWNNAASVGGTLSDNTCTWTNVGTGGQDQWLAWAASTGYASSGGFGGFGAMFIEPVSNNSGGYVYQETVGSCSSGTTQPIWPQTVGGTVSDGSCTWKNTGARGSYENQLGLEDDGVLNGHSQDGVHILNNVVKWGGGHNLLQVHYDTGAVLVQGNTVGPGAVHGAIDVKGVGSPTALAQVISNIAMCGYNEGLCGCEANNSCSSGQTPAFYTQNGASGTTENLIYQLNLAYDSGTGFQVDPNIGSSTAYINAKYYNNTVYMPTSAGWAPGLYSDGGSHSGSSIDVRNNIFDGGSYSINVSGTFASATEDYNDIGGAQGSAGFNFNGSSTKGPHDMTNVDPKYVNPGGSPPNFSLQAGSPCLNAGLIGLTSGTSSIGAY